MAVKIRLQRRGKRGRPFYRIVVMDERKKRDGKTLATLGFYDPTALPPLIKVDQKLTEYWQLKGAQKTKAVTKLLKP